MLRSLFLNPYNTLYLHNKTKTKQTTFNFAPQTMENAWGKPKNAIDGKTTARRKKRFHLTSGSG